MCLKFRGIRRTREILRKATEAALSSYVVTQDNVPGELESPHMAFAFCYVASHFGLGLISKDEGPSILDFVEARKDELIRLIDDEKISMTRYGIIPGTEELLMTSTADGRSGIGENGLKRICHFLLT